MPLPETLAERAARLSRSTPTAKALEKKVNERISQVAHDLENSDLLEIMQMPSGAGRRFMQNLVIYSRKSGSADPQFREGKRYWAEYYFERLGWLSRELQSQLSPPITPPYELEAKRREFKAEEINKAANK